MILRAAFSYKSATQSSSVLTVFVYLLVQFANKLLIKCW
jgi:hypothetical protein